MNIHIRKEIADKSIRQTFTSEKYAGYKFRNRLRAFLYENILDLFYDNDIDVPDIYVANIKTKTAKKVLVENVAKKWNGLEYLESKPYYDFNKCLNKYDDSYYSYMLPAFESYKEYVGGKPEYRDKCLGNFIIPLPPKYAENITFTIEFPFKIVGYSTDVGISKQKPFAVIVGVFIDLYYMRERAKKYVKQCTCPDFLMVEETHSVLLPVFQCQCCGAVYYCSCFDDYYKNLNTANVFLHSYEGRYKNTELQKRDNLCQLCSSTEYPEKLPFFYYDLIKKQHPELKTPNEIKNVIREKFGVKLKPVTGYKGESLLYEIIVGFVGKENVLLHHRPQWLQGLEIDIFIPSLNLGFEYQGQQHYKPIEHFGGQEAFEDLQRRDKLKKEICAKVGVKLYEFRYDEEIYPDDVLKIITVAQAEVKPKEIPTTPTHTNTLSEELSTALANEAGKTQLSVFEKFSNFFKNIF